MAGVPFSRSQVGSGNFGFDQIAQHFLKKKTSLDFGCGRCRKGAPGLNSVDPGRYEFDVRVIDSVTELWMELSDQFYVKD